MGWLVLDEYRDLLTGGVFDHLLQGRIFILGIETEMAKEFFQPPETVLCQVVGVLHPDFIERLAVEDFLEFVGDHVLTGLKDLMGELNELRLLLGGLVVARQALDHRDVCTCGEWFWAFDFAGCFVEEF